MDKMSAPSSRERAQRLYEKNMELENRRRRSAQARVPSDPNAWQQMRENYEAIILEDHAFTEQHNIEYALWQLHYKRIEELRAHFSAALTSAGSNTSQGVKGPTRPDRVTKIRLQFKTFLSEATGFYHDLILKIRAKYGLPLGGYFSEDTENQIVTEKDGKKSAEMKKGLISCHRCLIYLGDLARYKGLYGEGDSKSREFAAASSYYLEAASLWPSSGNPHHQLAILASYSGDELVAVYRYFRSLAVNSPFPTARDNLIVAFEKNRQSYSQLPEDVKASVVKESPVRLTGKGRGKGDTKFASKDTNSEGSQVKERASTLPETYKSFCIRFVRLNGILFTRTSLETFAEVHSLVSGGLRELLSSGPEEELNFGADAIENGLLIVRLISILIFTIHNVKRETEGQTYSEIVQRAVLLQNAFTAVFELMGHILERCVQLHYLSSSYLLPGILVFVEWLACCPDVAAGSEADEKQESVRSKFWKNCISFLNKLLSNEPMSIDDGEDETFFNNTRYEEGETENRLALWEDFELRGFLPLLPAQTILDFSRKHSFGGEGNKEKLARVKRILAAGKALANMVRVDQETIHFDSKAKKFVIGIEPQILDDCVFTTTYAGMPNTNGMLYENQMEKTKNLGILQPNPELYMEGEEEDEVIVFKPTVAERRTDVIGLKWDPYEGLEPGQNASAGDLKFLGGSVSAPLGNLRQQIALDVDSQVPTSVGNMVPQHLQPIQSHASKWSVEEEALLANGLKGLRFVENGHIMKSEQDFGISTPALSASIQQAVSANTSGMSYSYTKAPEAVTLAFTSSRAMPDNLAVKTSSALPAGLRKNPVSRPVRHIGPPPGFSPVRSKQVNESISGLDLVSGNPLMDDYSWLDGYQLPSSTNSPGPNGPNSSVNHPSYSNPQPISISNGFSGTVSFPFPGKQVPTIPFSMEKQNGWQEYQTLEQLNLHNEQQLQQQHQHQLINGNQHFTPLPDQYPGQSVWTGRYFV
ncbi:nonsense-mediated mRNA decay factor SMG7 isoform X2 [Corylus avellana]|nr:nonsense-mediated mRNA decay factor SMG7 isoform X2 [Corylus avellana]